MLEVDFLVPHTQAQQVGQYDTKKGDAVTEELWVRRQYMAL